MKPESRKAYFAKKKLWTQDKFKVVQDKHNHYVARYHFSETRENSLHDNIIRIFKHGGKTSELAKQNLEKLVNQKLNNTIANMSPANENTVTFGKRTFMIERENTSPYRKHIMLETDENNNKVNETELDESSYL